MRKRKRYVAVGIGGRIPMFLEPIAGKFRDATELVGLCDTSFVRMRHHLSRLQETYNVGEVALFAAEAFDEMLERLRPDAVIVCTPDATHHDYIIRSLQAGCDVICEKPITTDEEKARQILEAVKATGRKVDVAFNYRWAPGKTRIRQLLREGAIGRVIHVSLDYLLDTRHGADYFRRWHSQREHSGGLLVHKATHHFDLVNWWLDALPERVFASGQLAFYGRENAVRRGDGAWTGYDRYTGEPKAAHDPFALDLEADPRARALYREAEEESGYIRDRNVFRDGITIEDSMSVLVEYHNGTRLNYSLNAFCPYEGFRVNFTGDRGRLEYGEFHRSHLIVGQSNGELGDEQGENNQCRLMLYPLFGEAQRIPIPLGEGGHGGADPLLQEQLFSPAPPAECEGRQAGHEQGIISALIGIAANQSMKSRSPVAIADLLPDFVPGRRRLSELI